MKRLTPALSLFFAMLIDSAGSAQSTDTEHMLNLNDCRIMLIFARVWNKSPLIQRENATWIVVNSQGEYESKAIRTRRIGRAENTDSAVHSDPEGHMEGHG